MLLTNGLAAAGWIPPDLARALCGMRVSTSERVVDLSWLPMRNRSSCADSPVAPTLICSGLSINVI
jgi:hypothetical protein